MPSFDCFDTLIHTIVGHPFIINCSIIIIFFTILIADPFSILKGDKHQYCPSNVNDNGTNDVQGICVKEGVTIEFALMEADSERCWPDHEQRHQGSEVIQKDH